MDRKFYELLNYSVDSDEYWVAVDEIRTAGTELVWEYIMQQCKSDNLEIRHRAVDVLAQIRGRDEPTTVMLLVKILENEQNDKVIHACISALGHQYYHCHSTFDSIEKYFGHENPDIRQAVAIALPKSNCEEEAAKTLIKLMSDEVAMVRDWATFSLGSLMSIDSPDIREAFVERLEDNDLDVVVEAIEGLASRGDLRALPQLIWHLERDDSSFAIRDAAIAMLKLDNDPKNWGSIDFVLALREKFPGQV